MKDEKGNTIDGGIEPSAMGARGGAAIGGPVTRYLMSDERYQPTLREQLALGVGKAHRAVNYSHFEYRNYGRSYLRTQGKVG